MQSGQYPNGPSFGEIYSVGGYLNYPPGDKKDMCDSFDSAFTSDDPTGTLAFFINTLSSNDCGQKHITMWNRIMQGDRQLPRG